MPSHLLNTGNAPRGQKFDLVGRYVDGSTFVKHVALLSQDESLGNGLSVMVLHMGPPLAGPGNPFSMTCDLLGQVNLTNDEPDAIANWVAQVETQYTQHTVAHFQQYFIQPHMVLVYSENNRPIRQRFSCAGYAIEAYRNADIDLLNLDSLPDTNWDDVVPAYQDLARILGLPVAVQRKFGFISREDLGISGNGPWKIALPGYLFHATQQFQSTAQRPSPYVPPSISQASYP